ncbi:MAG: ATP-binding protein [Acidobacteria bacterium]|nr:ATP-binding protein [Acidobacteriota bacterium]
MAGLTEDIRSTRLPPETASVPAARAFAEEALGEFGAGEGTTERARLLVSELATNVVLHAHTNMRLSVRRCRHGVRVEVRDDIPVRLPRPREPDPMSVHGRGLVLVEALSDAWGVNGNTRGKTIWFEV